MSNTIKLHVYAGHHTFIVTEVGDKKYVLAYGGAWRTHFIEVDHIKYVPSDEMPTDLAERAQVNQLKIHTIDYVTPFGLHEAEYFTVESDAAFTKVAVCYDCDEGRHYLHVFGATDGSMWMLRQPTGEKVNMAYVNFAEGWLMYRSDEGPDFGNYNSDMYRFEADCATRQVVRG